MEMSFNSKNSLRLETRNQSEFSELACESGSPGKGGPARNPLLCRIYSFSQRTRNLIGSK